MKLDTSGNLHADADGRFAGHIHTEASADVLIADTTPALCACGAPARADGSDGDGQVCEQWPLCEKGGHFDWGSTGVRQGSRTPWGSADVVTCPVPGIAVVQTPGHGGIKLSPERNAVVPPALRSRSGWYEEDCEAHIVAWTHPDAFPNFMGGDLEAIREDGRRGVIDYFPDKYEQATGQVIPFGESSVKDRATYEAENAGKPCLYTQGAQESRDYPGMVVVTTDRIPAHNGHFNRHMIPVGDYRAADERRRYGAATVEPLLPASAIEVPEAPVEKPAAPKPVTTVSTVGLTPAQAARARADLHKRWQDRHGHIFTYGDSIRDGMFAGKSVTYDNQGRAEYNLKLVGGSVLPVSKALWDAYQAPDERSRADLALAQYRSKQAAADRADDNWDRTRAQKLTAEAAKLYDEYQRLNTAEAEAKRPAREAAQASAAAEDKARLDAAYAQAKASGLV